MAFDEGLTLFHELTKQNALQSCETLFAGSKSPDGIFASNDTSALAVVEFAKEHKIAIPKQLKVVGYSNDSRTEISNPTITSVEQFPHNMGEQAANLMMDILQGREGSGRGFISLTTPVELIKRTSSGN